MKRALGEAAVVAEAEVDDRKNHAPGVAAVAAGPEVDDRSAFFLSVVGA